MSDAQDDVERGMEGVEQGKDRDFETSNVNLVTPPIVQPDLMDQSEGVGEIFRESTLPPPKKKTKVSKHPSSVSPPLLTTERTLERSSRALSSSSTSRAGTPIIPEQSEEIPLTTIKKKTQKKTTKPAKTVGRKKKKLDRAVSEEEEEGGVKLEEVVEAEEEEAVVDTKLYCICQANYDEERMMIACDKCDDWYHTACMNIQNDQAELVDVFICPNCEKGTDQRTTWKPKCVRTDCTHAALRPLSRYCSERCGILVAFKRIKSVQNTSSTMNGNGGGTARSNTKMMASNEKVLAEKYLKIPRIALAKRREGISIWSMESNEDRLHWLTSLLGQSATDQIESLIKEEMQKMANQIPTLQENEQVSIILPLIEECVRIQTQLQQTQTKRDVVNEKLDLLASRIKFLHLAEDRASTLEPIRGEEQELSATNVVRRGGKKKTKVAAVDNGRGQPRCGYDERLHWDDAQFHAWSTSTTGKEILSENQALDGELEGEKDSMQTDKTKICGHSKRRCKRHVDWSIIRGADFDVDRERQTRILSDLAIDVQEIELRLQTVKVELQQALMDENDRRKQVDERLARSLANEGSRRAVVT